MLAAIATSMPALERAFAVKQRDRTQVMHVACASVAMAASIGVLTPAALRLLGALTPGPLSVVVAKTAALPDTLVAVNGTVGIRVPDHPATLQVIAELGVPVTATSLNVTGTAPLPVAKLDLDTLNWRGDQGGDPPRSAPPAGETIYIVEDDEAIRYATGSTLVRLTGEQAEILRPGPVSDADVSEALAVPSYLERSLDPGRQS